MIQRTLQQVEQMANGSGLAKKFVDVVIEGVTINSREVMPGNLFVPIKGARFNGHDFVASAFESGAAATLWQRGEENSPTDVPVIYVEDTLIALQELASNYRQQLTLKIVGITGSNGKTSTKDILASLLAPKFTVHKTAGNYNNHLGLPLTLLDIGEEVDVAVLEMGMTGLGEIELLTKIAQPDGAIITNIGEAHIQELGSRENISIAKFEIIQGLTNDGIFSYHGDEPLLQSKVAQSLASYKKVTFGESSENDYYPITMENVNGGTTFTIKDSDVSFHVPALGKHNVMNTLAAMAVAKEFGVTYEEMNQGLKNLEMTKMRMEMVETTSGLTVINDAYNASPASVKAGLDLVHTLLGYNRKIVVLGDMLELGDNEIAYHEEVGAFIDPDKIDAVYTYGELGKSIAKVAENCKLVKSYLIKQDLIADLQQYVKPGDLVFVKASRGMKLEEVVFALE